MAQASCEEAKLLYQETALTAFREVADALAAMGIDKMDPATMAIMGAQLKSMLSGDAAEPFNVELATDVARKSVAAEGDAVVGDAARRQIEQAVAAASQPMRVGLEYVVTYRGKPIAAGSKSVTITLTYRSSEGTLRGEQVDEQVQQVLASLQRELTAEIRK